jgi:hypothetical protein
MDGTFLHTAAWVGLGWLGLATLATVGLSKFLRGAHLREKALPIDEPGLRRWVRR